MSTEAYEDYNARRAAPGFRRNHVVAPQDTVELPAIMVSEDAAAEDSILRFLTEQQRATFGTSLPGEQLAIHSED